MRFFSPEVCDTFDDYEPFRQVYEAYRRYLEGLSGVLPERVLELAEPSGMEDALVVRVDHDRARRTLRLTLRCGDLQMGYSNLALTYEDAELRPDEDAALARIARSTKSQNYFGCELAYHELDVTEYRRIEHRLIFHASELHLPTAGGWIEFAVRCRALRWWREPRRTRRLSPSQDRYPSGPSD